MKKWECKYCDFMLVAKEPKWKGVWFCDQLDNPISEIEVCPFQDEVKLITGYEEK